MSGARAVFAAVSAVVLSAARTSAAHFAVVPASVAGAIAVVVIIAASAVVVAAPLPGALRPAGAGAALASAPAVAVVVALALPLPIPSPLAAAASVAIPIRAPALRPRSAIIAAPPPPRAALIAVVALHRAALPPPLAASVPLPIVPRRRARAPPLVRPLGAVPFLRSLRRCAVAERAFRPFSRSAVRGGEWSERLSLSFSGSSVRCAASRPPLASSSLSALTPLAGGRCGRHAGLGGRQRRVSGAVVDVAPEQFGLEALELDLLSACSHAQHTPTPSAPRDRESGAHLHTPGATALCAYRWWPVPSP